MDPQYNQPAYTENSLEYLNQIAPAKPPVAGFLNKKLIAIIGAVLVVVIIVIAVALNSKPAETPPGQIVGYRLTGLNELITFSQNATVNDSGLRKALAETKVIAISEQYQISTYVTLPKVDNKNPVPSDEAVTQTVDTLNKSIARGNFNKSLSEALITQIKKVQSALVDIRSTASQATATKIDDDLTQYDAIIERLTNY